MQVDHIFQIFSTKLWKRFESGDYYQKIDLSWVAVGSIVGAVDQPYKAKKQKPLEKN